MIALQSLIERAARLNPTGVATTYKGTDLTCYGATGGLFGQRPSTSWPLGR